MKLFKSSFLPFVLVFCIIFSSCSGVDTEEITEGSDADTTTKIEDTTDNISSDESEYKIDEEYSYETWRKNAYDYLKSVTITADGGSIYISDDSATLAWGTSYMLDALYKGYCATGDIAFLDQFAIYAFRVYELMADKDGDGFLNWGTGNYSDNGEYKEYAVHCGMVTSITGSFVCLVNANPSLAEKETPLGMTYGEFAEYIIDRTVNHLIPTYDRDWDEDLGVYMEHYRRISLPHNQYLVMAMAMMKFAVVSPEHCEEYIHRAEKMLDTFNRYVIRFPSIDAVTWCYDDIMFDGDESAQDTEDFSHGMLDVRAAIFGYENGLVFSLEDIETFANNYSVFMHRDSEDYPMLSSKVDGTGSTTGDIYYWIYDIAMYREAMMTRGMEYLINSGTAKSQDSIRILVYHPYTPTPEDFSLTYPENQEESVNPDFSVFCWQRAPYANYYCVQIAEDAEFENIIVNRDKIQDSSVIVKYLPEDSTLYYRVIAKNMSGEETVSDTYSFKTGEAK